jgi:hypothetical protein
MPISSLAWASPAGHIKVLDIIQKARLIDVETWDTQWGSKEPGAIAKVFPNFDKDFHGVTWEGFASITGYERPPDHWRFAAGLDLGTVMAYELAAIESVEYQGAVFDRWWFHQEIYDNHGLTTSKRAAAIKEKEAFWRGLLVMADPANKQERNDFDQDGGIPTVEAIKDVLLSIRRVRDLTAVAPDGLPYVMFIREECPWAVHQMEHYSHPVGPDGLPDKFDVIKRDDHCVDAIRYVVYTYELIYKAQDTVRKIKTYDQLHGKRV